MKPMKVGDLVALSSYGENLDGLYIHLAMHRVQDMAKICSTPRYYC